MKVPRLAMALVVMFALTAGAGVALAHDKADGEDKEKKVKKRVTICHVPDDNFENAQTLELPAPAADAHLEQHENDFAGPCEAKKR